MSESPDATGNAVASCVIQVFNALPLKFKPSSRTAHAKEWVPLSGIVIVDDNVRCVSLGTGMKCLPRSKISVANGNVLHDCHAEILAIRAFNRFLIQECLKLANDSSAESYIIIKRVPSQITKSSPQPFTIKEALKIYMYCSEAPCGDASMELVMRTQEDPTPWAQSSPKNYQEMPGRADFSRLGIVRRKPARPDAPQSLSKSCTDKLTVYQCISLLRGVTTLLISPENAYLTAIVLPKSQHIPKATTRAFSPIGRMSNLKQETVDSWSSEFRYKPFSIVTTAAKFDFSRKVEEVGGRLISSNKSVIWCPYVQEVLVGGVLQGRKVSDPRGASEISRRKMWQAVMKVLEALEDSNDSTNDIRVYKDYRSLKSNERLKPRRMVKTNVTTVLQGWVQNDGDDSFCLD